MAAWDLFASFLDSLTAKDREALKEPTSSHRADLLAARSEEARLRVANDFVRGVKEYLKAVKR